MPTYVEEEKERERKEKRKPVSKPGRTATWGDCECKETPGYTEHPFFLSVTGEMAQKLRALAVFPEDCSPIPSSHMVTHNHL